MTNTRKGLSRSDLRTLTLSALGAALEFYDFIIFVFFTAAIAVLFFPPDMPEWLRVAQTFGIFAAGYLIRPLGGIAMAHFGDLETLLARVDEVPFLRLRGARQTAARLREHAAQARLCRQLTTIALDAPLGAAIVPFHRGVADAGQLGALCERLRFGPLTRRRLQMAAGLDALPGTLPDAAAW